MPAQVPTASDPVPLLSRERAILEFNRRVCSPRPDGRMSRCWSGCATSASCRPTWTSSSRCGSRTRSTRPACLTATRAMPMWPWWLADAHALIDEQYRIFNDEVMPALATEQIVIVNHADRDDAQRQWVAQFFHREVQPLLVPVGLDPAHPFPQVANKIAQLHRPARRHRRFRAREHHRHRQGAARAAAGDPDAGAPGGRATGVRAADQRDPGRTWASCSRSARWWRSRSSA